jgi:hypothetical protein
MKAICLLTARVDSVYARSRETVASVVAVTYVSGPRRYEMARLEGFEPPTLSSGG